MPRADLGILEGILPAFPIACFDSTLSFAIVTATPHQYHPAVFHPSLLAHHSVLQTVSTIRHQTKAMHLSAAATASGMGKFKPTIEHDRIRTTEEMEEIKAYNVRVRAYKALVVAVLVGIVVVG